LRRPWRGNASSAGCRSIDRFRNLVDHLVATIPQTDDVPICDITHRHSPRSGRNPTYLWTTICDPAHNFGPSITATVVGQIRRSRAVRAAGFARTIIHPAGGACLGR
jgi:hypothetical protein